MRELSTMKKIFQSTVTVTLASLCLQANASVNQDNSLLNATILQDEKNVVHQEGYKMTKGDRQFSGLASCDESFMASRLLQETEFLTRDATNLNPNNAEGAAKLRTSSQWIFLFPPGRWYKLS